MKAKEIDIRWTPFALGCLDEIHDYIILKEKSHTIANKFINTLFERVDQLKTFPESGQKEPLQLGFEHESRYLVEASYKIIYEYDHFSQQVIITDVFHTSQYPLDITRSKK